MKMSALWDIASCSLVESVGFRAGFSTANSKILSAR
jgi:hypothetical protein